MRLLACTLYGIADLLLWLDQRFVTAAAWLLKTGRRIDPRFTQRH